MRGFVPTPELIVDLMVAKLFERKPPSRDSAILDPGCGPGAFIDGIVRWCAQHGAELPQIVGVEVDPDRHAAAAAKFAPFKRVEIRREDFLVPSRERFDYVIGNPPYVSITSFSEREKMAFREAYQTARGRFDLYLLFFEQSLRLLAPDGRLVFITPEKFLYVKTAEPLRRLLSELDVREIQLADEETFGSLVTYPTITTVDNRPRNGQAKVILRDGVSRRIAIPCDGSSLMPLLNGHTKSEPGGHTLEDICVRVSCGVATGADNVFVRETESLTKRAAKFAYPTISGRQLVPGQEHVNTRHSMLIPYDRNGKLMDLQHLGELGDYLSHPKQRRRLSARTCAKKKPWHAFHDSVPLNEILLPKLLCKDIAAAPSFWIDRAGSLVPRHSVYYIVPRDPGKLDMLASYLNSSEALNWMKAHCQRAANGFLRLQSAVLKKLPIPDTLAAPSPQHRAPPRTPSSAFRQMHAALALSR